MIESSEGGTSMIEERNEKDDVQFDEAHLREMLEAHNIDAFRDEF